MSAWAGKVKLIIKDAETNNTAVKNRFPPQDFEAQSLHQILNRLKRGDIAYEAIEIIVTGMQRQDIPLLISGGHNMVSERDRAP